MKRARKPAAKSNGYMHSSYFKGMPWRHFKEFISPNADRFSILNGILKELALDYSVPEIAGNRHFVIAPQSEGYRSPVVLVAHYDRYEGSPGANDNSAGVFLLLETAARLKKKDEKNWIIIFTDKEELKPGEGITSQGSYSLAKGLLTVKMKGAKVFCFDVCGAGDSFIISTTLDYLLNREGTGEKIQRSLKKLQNMALDAARELRTIKVFLAPTPLSDDAGFFRAGLAAQTITTLPAAEYNRLSAELRKNPEFAEVLVNAEIWKNNRTRAIPETWRILNSPGDSHLRLTPEHFRTVIRFAETLCSDQ